MTEFRFDGSFADWKRVARIALASGCDPSEAIWIGGDLAQSDLPLTAAHPSTPATGTAPGSAGVPPASACDPETPDVIRVSRRFLALAQEVTCHSHDARWALLYRTLWRLTHGEPHLLEVSVDPDVASLHAMAKSVHRDLHKMRAFVRFRAVESNAGIWFVAWFEPQHHIVEANAPFFRDRFASMHWSILTPGGCAHWDTRELTFTPGVPRSTAPTADAVEHLWRTYYASVFNPARVSVPTMAAQMPRRYWNNLPEAELIPSLVAEAGSRVDGMLANSLAEKRPPAVFGRAQVPDTAELGTLRDAALHCQACPLWRNATCTVFGEGPAAARVVLVGEQPGDQEDRAGKPFVGPAGQLLSRALEAAGLDRGSLYLTNAVKHFKWEPRGKRRLHQRPNSREIAACRPWLEAELHALRPELIVCLGATAAGSVLNRQVRVLSERGQLLETEFGVPALVTVHPSALLRLPPGSDPDAEFQRFVDDLRRIGGRNALRPESP